MATRIKFAGGSGTAFFREVRAQVQTYFQWTGTSPYADRRLWAKAALFAGIGALSYGALLTLPLGVLRAELANLGLGMAHTHVRINAKQVHNAIRRAVGTRFWSRSGRARWAPSIVRGTCGLGVTSLSKR